MLVNLLVQSDYFSFKWGLVCFYTWELFDLLMHFILIHQLSIQMVPCFAVLRWFTHSELLLYYVYIIIGVLIFRISIFNIFHMSFEVSFFFSCIFVIIIIIKCFYIMFYIMFLKKNTDYIYNKALPCCLNMVVKLLNSLTVKILCFYRALQVYSALPLVQVRCCLFFLYLQWSIQLLRI